MDTKFNPIIPVKEDGLHIDEVGEWAESKYNLIGQYCDIFTKTMRNKWKQLLYIDLFSGCGYSRIRETEKVIKGSPLISISIPNKFSHYIFCEEDYKKYNALKMRAERDGKTIKNAKFNIINGDCNDKIDEIISLIPPYSKNNTLLSFCFIDPYNIMISFSTIKKLSKYNVDFMILLALGMDARRNLPYYLKENNKRVDNLLDDSKWRLKFLNNYNQTNSDFVRFIAKEFNSKMQDLGYQEPGEFLGVRSSIKNLDLYHIAFYSKNPLGNHFWDEVKKYLNEQQRLSFS